MKTDKEELSEKFIVISTVLLGRTLMNGRKKPGLVWIRRLVTDKAREVALYDFLLRPVILPAVCPLRMLERIVISIPRSSPCEQ
jgi:hypothetical protein